MSYGSPMMGGTALKGKQLGAPGGGGGGGGGGGFGGNPMQPIYAPNPPQGQATFSNLNINPQATLAQILRGFMPVQRQATNALNNTLASSGIVGGGAQGAQNLLQGQLSASIAPTLANAIQTAQGLQLNQAQGNQQAANAMTGLNLQDLMQTNMMNTTTANDARMALAQMLQQAWLARTQGAAGILGTGLSGAAGLAGQEAQNFPVYQNQTLLGMLGI